MEITASSSPLRERYSKWLKLLYIFYKYLDLSPISTRTLRENPQIIMDLETIGIKGDWNLRTTLDRIYDFHYVYRFGEIKWQGYSYLINLRGLDILKFKGLITEEQEQYARPIVLQILQRVDPKKYHKVILNVKK